MPFDESPAPATAMSVSTFFGIPVLLDTDGYGDMHIWTNRPGETQTILFTQYAVSEEAWAALLTIFQ